MDPLRARLETLLAGQYAFERELGGGGMSRTYLMREVALQRDVVLKVLAPELVAGLSVERFRREILLAAHLQHPHVVPVLAMGDVDGIPWFTMPYVAGDSLRQRLVTGPLPITETISILRDVARALAYAHAQGVVHRDIKPDNVLLSSGTATVTDFGIAKALQAARTLADPQATALTQAGTSIGTPAYMAPEQALGDPTTDHRADLYAFGAMGYELLTGALPITGDTPAKLLAARMRDAPPPISQRRADCPPALATILMACLAQDPADRPPDAAAILAALEGSHAPVSPAPLPLGRALLIWLGAMGAVALITWALTLRIDLPDWVLPAAALIMLLGLPLLLVASLVQRIAARSHAAPSVAPKTALLRLAVRAGPLLTSRRLLVGGAGAVGTFALLVLVLMGLRSMGLGPLASLQGQGAFGASETLMIADFSSPPHDATLGPTVAEALRTDVAQSTSLRVLSRAAYREALARMQRPVDTLVDLALAREIATREGAKAVLDGTIDQLGARYVISARLVSPLDGTELAHFREIAADQDALLGAIGRMSRQVRARAGESFRTIRASAPLERVTTPSLEALRRYVEGLRLADQDGESDRGLLLLREAVQLDSSFAMAWRKIAVLLNNTPGHQEEDILAAIEQAWRHRDRLTDMERLLTEAFYYWRGPAPDRNRVLAAYRAAALLDTLAAAPLNNAAAIYTERYDYEAAESLYRRVVRLPHTFGGAFTNLLQTQIVNRRSPATLDSTVALYRATFPESQDLWEAEAYAALGAGDVATLDRVARAVALAPRTRRQLARSSNLLAARHLLAGQPIEALAWLGRRHDLLQREQPGATSRLASAIDSAYVEAVYGSAPAALATLRRGMAAAPMAAIAAADRPWADLIDLGLRLGDPALVREAVAGFTQDAVPLANDQVGAHAFGQAALALAESRWADALRQLQPAEQRFEMAPRDAAYWRGLAYHGLGRSDSALVAFTRFLATPDITVLMDGLGRAEVLRRVAELHETRGEPREAMARYEELLQLWTAPDARVRPRAREIERRIAALRATSG